jgi:phosphoribosylaminoimidazolecarboxamide formyltransferase/IMP cyclohydrolase
MSATIIKTGLLSVYDKTGIVEFAQGLCQLGVEIISTGGTAKLLSEKGVHVQEIADYTGFPEILNGRVKTLHPKIHAGLLYRRSNQSDVDTVQRLGIRAIDLVAINLYPFEKVAASKPNLGEVIENIDIGGLSMIRSAAKNYHHVAVVTDPADYSRVLVEAQSSGGGLSEKTRLELMLKAFERTAAYDAAISAYFQDLAVKEAARTEWPGPNRLVLSLEKLRDLRYGENPHQQAAVYKEANAGSCIAAATQVAGEKELSYTNILDADAAYSLILELKDSCAAAIIKHTNPCGVGKAVTLAESCRKALETDPVSAFGGIYAFTRQVDVETAGLLGDKFVELILAPGYDAEALKILSLKKNRRILDVSALMSVEIRQVSREKSYRRIHGGLLYQDADTQLLDEGKLKNVTKRQPTQREKEALLFGWKLVKHVKSNAIVLCSNDQLIGVGAGQMSRVDSCKIALMKAQEAGLKVKGAVMASDAFLPFRDSVDITGKAGVTAIIEPGGSLRDPEVVKAADEYGMAILFTGLRHFVH